MIVLLKNNKAKWREKDRKKRKWKYRKTIAVQNEDCYNKKQTECRKQKLRKISVLLEDEGSAERFPYDVVETISGECTG